MHDYLQAKIELNGSATNNSDQNSAVLLHPVVNDSKQLNNYWIKELYEHYHPIIFNKKCWLDGPYFTSKACTSQVSVFGQLD